MRGACTCLHLGRQVQKEHKREGEEGGAMVQPRGKKKGITGENVSNTSDRDTTTQHEIMLPEKTANDARNELLFPTFLHNTPER